MVGGRPWAGRPWLADWSNVGVKDVDLSLAFKREHVPTELHIIWGHRKTKRCSLAGEAAGAESKVHDGQA